MKTTRIEEKKSSIKNRKARQDKQNRQNLTYALLTMTMKN
jgi:hypothetical protein